MITGYEDKDCDQVAHLEALLVTDWQVVSLNMFVNFISFPNPLCRFHLKTETESSLRNVVIQIKDRTIDNVQNCDSYKNKFYKLAVLTKSKCKTKN
jgi:hypothetical protein